MLEELPHHIPSSLPGKGEVLHSGLEAIIDHNLWFWHAAFGFMGSCNDINILDVSPLHQQFTLHN